MNDARRRVIVIALVTGFVGAATFVLYRRLQHSVVGVAEAASVGVSVAVLMVAVTLLKYRNIIMEEG